MGEKEGDAGAEEGILALPRLREWCSAGLVAGAGLLYAEVEYEASLHDVRVRAKGVGIDGAGMAAGLRTAADGEEHERTAMRALIVN
jgi:hypothetical protein